jgi:hypothetical protein
MRQEKHPPQRLHTELTECGFYISNNNWVYDPDLAGIEYVFSPPQLTIHLDQIIREVLTFPIQHKRWQVRYRSLLAGLRREALERQIPMAQALYFVTCEVFADILPTLPYAYEWDAKTSATWRRRLKRAVNREVSRVLLAQQRQRNRETLLGHAVDEIISAPAEGETLQALADLVNNPHLTAGDRCVAVALFATGGNIRATAAKLRHSEAAIYKQYQRLLHRLRQAE